MHIYNILYCIQYTNYVRKIAWMNTEWYAISWWNSTVSSLYSQHKIRMTSGNRWKYWNQCCALLWRCFVLEFANVEHCDLLTDKIQLYFFGKYFIKLIIHSIALVIYSRFKYCYFIFVASKKNYFYICLKKKKKATLSLRISEMKWEKKMAISSSISHVIVDLRYRSIFDFISFSVCI